MIKSELVQKIAAQNPHLYHHHVENVVNAVLTEIMAAMRRGDRVEFAWFWRVFGEAQIGAQRSQSAHRGPRRCGPEKRSILQDRQRNARAAKSHGRSRGLIQHPRLWRP